MDRKIRTTGDLLHAFAGMRRRAKEWLERFSPGGRPRLHLFPPALPARWPASRDRVALFPGSFDPPTRAHLRIVRAALRRGPFRTIWITFDLSTLDKPRHATSLADRIALASIAFRKEARVGVAVSTHGRFLEKVQAARRERLGGRGIWFVVGDDTMDRVLHPRYYARPRQEIGRLLGSARFVVFPRKGFGHGREEYDGLRPRSVTLPLSPSLQEVSSTGVRRSLRAGRFPMGEAPDEVLYCIWESGLYRPGGRARSEVVTAFLTKGGRVLVLERSGKVGSFQGRWAGVSGFLEWPLSSVGEILRNRISSSEIRARSVHQARREIREETGLTDRRTSLTRRHAPLKFRDRSTGRDWVVYPFLFRVEMGAPIRLDWEHDEGRWIWPDELRDLPTVPGLSRALRSVLPATKGRKPAGTFSGRAAEIARDPKGGAMEIFSSALLLLRELAEYGPEGEGPFEKEVDRTCSGLLSGHPMAPLENLVEAVRNELSATGSSGKSKLSRCLDRMERESERGSAAVLRKARRALARFRRIATYSYSSTTLAALSAAGSRPGVEVRVVRDRGGHGARLRRRLLRAGVRAATLVSRLPDDTDALVLGADAVYGRRAFLNARGTGRIVNRARRLGISVWVLAHPLKVRSRRPQKMTDPALEMIPARGVQFVGM